MRGHIVGFIRSVVWFGVFATSAAAQTPNQLRIFFSDNPLGVADPSVPGPTPANAEVAGRLLAGPDNDNPVLAATADSARVYVWAAATGGSGVSTWSGISVNVVVTGPATITGGGLMQVGSTTATQRWDPLSDFTQPGFNLLFVIDGKGVRQPPRDDGWNDGTSVLLGYLDLALNGGTSTLKFAVGNAGIVRSGGVPANDEVLFGWGDAALRGNQFGAVSALPDLTIAEPEACCMADGECVEVLTDECSDGGGIPQGSGTLCATAICPQPPQPKGTGITYQGQLKSGGVPLDGPTDLQFSLWEDPTSPALDDQIGDPINFGAQSDGPPDPAGPPVNVVNGLLTVELDFGPNAFASEARWLEIAVRHPADPSNSGLYTTLRPRQAITPTACAMFALSAANGHALDAADGDPIDALFVDSVGNVGIGTSTPGDRLHIMGGGLLLGPGGNLSKQDSGGVSRSLLLYDGSDNVQLLAPPDKTLSFRTGTGGFTSIRATLTAAGRLGIGTATPDVLVHLQSGTPGDSGTVTASNLLLERNGDNYLTFMSPVNRLGGLAFGRPGSTATELFHGAILYNESTLPDAMQFRTGGNSTHMTISARGGVGIGTTNPAADLHVVGGSASGAAFQAADVLAVEGGALPAIAIGMPAAGSGLFRFSKPSRSDAAKIQYNASTGQLFVLADGAVFLGTDSGSGFTSRMTVANDGDVGIGTNAPGAKLHVVASPSGNSSVILPNSSISAVEILDEPGCAGMVYSGADIPIGAAFPDPPESVLSQLITTPASGFVLAIATVGSRQVSTSAATVKWGLTTNPSSLPADALMIVEFNPAGGAGLWSMPVTLHRLFPVPAGATTVHVMAQGVFGSTEFGKAQLSLIYIPTTYGTAPVTAGGSAEFATAEIDSGDRSSAAASQADDLAGVLEQFRAERAALHAELESLAGLKAELEALRGALQRGE